jgi:hypothetical protein
LVKRENLKLVVIDIEQAETGGKTLKTPALQAIAPGTGGGTNTTQPMPALWTGCGRKKVPRPGTHYPHQPVRILNRLR